MAGLFSGSGPIVPSLTQTPIARTGDQMTTTGAFFSKTVEPELQGSHNLLPDTTLTASGLGLVLPLSVAAVLFYMLRKK